MSYVQVYQVSAQGIWRQYTDVDVTSLDEPDTPHCSDSLQNANTIK